MAPYKPQWYPSPLNLPAKQIGKMQIKHRIIPAGEQVNIIGTRQALLRGLRGTVGIAPKGGLLIHELYETLEKGRGALWMTDLPEELNQIEELIHNVRPFGRVLIGGLGLGILATRVATYQLAHGKRYATHDVTVVERSSDVIKLCGHPTLFRTVKSDIKKFLQTSKEDFDYFLLDTWAGTDEGCWWKEVMPLRRIIRNRWGSEPVIHCWAEDIMIGQLLRSMTSGNPPHWYYSYLPIPMSLHAAAAFLAEVGTETWENEFGAGVDRYTQECEERAATRKLETKNKRKEA